MRIARPWWMRCGRLARIGLLTALGGPAALLQAQTSADRPVGRPRDAPRLIVRQVDETTLGALAAAAGVPMGFESAAPPSVSIRAIPATGRRLHEVLDDIVAADPRYEWREDDGVVVLRPRVLWEIADPLDTPVDVLKLHDIHAGDAMQVLSTMVGTTFPGGAGDTVRFSIDVPAGTPFIHLLNAIVRAHGRLTWTLYYGRQSPGVMFLGLLSGGSGGSFGIQPGSYVSSIETSGWFPRFNAAVPLLDRIVGPARNGAPLTVGSISDVSALAEAIGAPAGVELVPPGARSLTTEPLTVTGLPVRDALLMLASRDPGYEARELDGVLVFRPPASWSDGAHPLFRPVKGIQLKNVTVAAAIELIASLLGRKDPSDNIADSRRFSVVLPSGSVLDLLNEVAKAHGALTWRWEENSATERKESGCRYTLSVALFGAGVTFGYLIP